ncbi:sugar ABC transporter substrate-binding protein [Paenibacillus beijingensis]|uniref:Sugar ABC transporter substrate-binding protein n=1 Tax=Paenibacillus beijingensis TaxID=1126833 RepID=A0A0D5NP60_9BACL|nr:maltose ABC transporter substrate-binding protein [Paenibacillus beijingensis]AJY76950.1 hypothetical protein VN24_23315 [Paenibacillus beijingensis]
MKKKLALLALSSVMTMSLAACGGKTDSANSGNEASNGTNQQNEAAANEELKPEEGATLVWWTLEDQKPYYEYAVQEFEKKYNIKVKVENVAYWDSVARMSTDGPAGTGADVFGLQNEGLSQAVKGGLVIPNDYFEEDTKQINRDEAIGAATYEGILYGYPWNVYTTSLYYNKDLVKDAKFDTWDDIIAFSKKFNDVKNNKFGFMFEGRQSFFDLAFMTGYGGYIFGNNETDTTDIGLNNEGSVKGLQFFQSLKEILPMKLTDMTGDVKSGLWQQGKLAINLDGSWAIGANSKLPFEVGVLPMPTLPGGENAKPLAGHTSYFVSAYSKYPNAAKLLAHFITTKEMQVKINELTGAIPAAKDVESVEGIRKDEMTQGFLKQIKNSHRVPNVPETQYVWQSLDPAVDAIWNGADVKTTLDKAAANIKSNIENQK